MASMNCITSASAFSENWCMAKMDASRQPVVDSSSIKIIDIITAASSDAFNDTGECVRPLVGLEFFPPRTEKGIDSLKERINRFRRVSPAFIDFTWGAGGSTAELTLDLTIEAKQKFGQTPNMHLTCTNMPVDKIDSALEACVVNGIRNIVALRGDPPAGTDRWEASDGGFKCARDLVEYVREKYGDYFCISVAGYPEGHPDRIQTRKGGVASLSESEKTRFSEIEGSDEVNVCSDEDWEIELDYLRSKCSAGADIIITQMFFDPLVYDRFVKDCRRVGITVPIIPGIMCLNTFAGFQRMTTLCKTRVPYELRAKITALKDDEVALKEFGIEYGEDMCITLLKMGAPVLHFYTLNLEKVTIGILQRLKLAGNYDAETEDVLVEPLKA